MHELALAEGILQLIEVAARDQGFTKVRTVRLDAVTRDSIAAGATLEIAETPGQGWCGQCALTVPMQVLYDSCPHCGSYLKITGGTELRVKELEVD